VLPYILFEKILLFQHWKWSARGTSTVPIVSAHLFPIVGVGARGCEGNAENRDAAAPYPVNRETNPRILDRNFANPTLNPLRHHVTYVIESISQ